MALESVTYISDLVATNPVGATDSKSQGDDHIRNIKAGLLASFPNLTGAMTATHTELNYLDGVTSPTGSGKLVLAVSPTLTGTLTAASAVITGNVGIGDTSPTELLEIAGDSDPTLLIRTDTADNANSGKVSFREAAGGSSGTDLRYDGSANNFIIDTSDVANALVIQRTTGYVGIGTASPSTRLHVDQAGEPPAEGMFILQANTSSRQLRVQPPTNSDNGFIDFRGGSLALLDDGIEVVRFAGGGNVGIGTADPASLLHIDEGEAGDCIIIAETHVDGDAYILFSQGASGAGTPTWGIGLDHSTGDTLSIGFEDTGYDDFSLTGDNKLVITTDGKVGIGDTSPTELLEIAGDSDPTLLIRTDTADNANSGKVSFREAAGGTTGVDLRYDGSANNFIIDTSDVANALVINRTTGTLETSNTITGGGLERVLTASDQGYWFQWTSTTKLSSNAAASGWTVTNPSTGKYTITHSLALSDVDDLMVQVSVARGANGDSGHTIVNRGANSFEVWLFIAGSLASIQADGTGAACVTCLVAA
jgi:hypothetical protein